MNVLTAVSNMRLETKYLRLKTPVTLGSRFCDWEVTWLGGWTRDRLSYLVMVVRVPPSNLPRTGATTERRSKKARSREDADESTSAIRQD
jgi:hypothetical protein